MAVEDQSKEGEELHGFGGFSVGGEQAGGESGDIMSNGGSCNSDDPSETKASLYKIDI